MGGVRRGWRGGGGGEEGRSSSKNRRKVVVVVVVKVEVVAEEVEVETETTQEGDVTPTGRVRFVSSKIGASSGPSVRGSWNSDLPFAPTGLLVLHRWCRSSSDVRPG